MFQVSKRPLLILVTPDRLLSIAVNSEMHIILLQLVAMNRMLAPQPSLLLLDVKNITTTSKFKTSAQKPAYYPWKPLVCHRAVILRLNIVRARFRSNGQLSYRFTLCKMPVRGVNSVPVDKAAIDQF